MSSAVLTAPAATKTISFEEVRALGPCCNLAEIDELRYFFLCTPSATADEILESDLPIDTRLEIAIRGGFLPEREVRLLACDFAELAQAPFKRVFRFDDLQASIDAARSYAMGWTGKWELDHHFNLLQGPDGLVYECWMRRERTIDDPQRYTRASDSISAAIFALEGDAYNARLAAGSALDGPDEWGIEQVRQYLRGDTYAG